MKLINKYLNISITKAHIKDLIPFINNSNKKNQIKQFCDSKTFFFTYNEVKNKNPNPSGNTKEFCQEQNIAIEFATRTINFQIVTKLDKIFIYNFKLYGIYLIDNKKKSVFMPSRRKYGLNKLLVLLSCTSKTSHHINLLNQFADHSIQI